MEEVILSKPVNFAEIRDDLKPFFIDSYTCHTQEVVALSNCFITYNGIVLSNLRYVNSCFYSPGTYKEKYYKWALKRWFYSKVSKWGRSNTQKLPQGTTYTIIHQPYINYFHWTIESLLRLMAFEIADKKAVLLVPSHLVDVKYIKDSLDILGVEYMVTEADKDLVVKDLLLPAMLWWGSRYDPALVKILAARFKAALQAKNIAPQQHDKVFVIRENGRRRVENAEEIKKIMTERGFHIIDFEGKTQQEQITVMAGAKIVVAQHGAGLTNILFMNPGSVVVEMHVDPAENNYMFDDAYYILASAMSHRYYGFISQKANPEADFFSSDHRININELVALLDKIEI